MTNGLTSPKPAKRVPSPEHISASNFTCITDHTTLSNFQNELNTTQLDLLALTEIRKDIQALEKETGGLLEEIIGAKTEAHP